RGAVPERAAPQRPPAPRVEPRAVPERAREERAGLGAPFPAIAAPPGTPEIRIGLGVGLPHAPLGGGAALLVTDPDGVPVVEIPAGERWTVLAVAGGVSVSSGGWRSTPALRLGIQAAPGLPVRVDDREYRGRLEILRDRTGLTLVNRVGLEDYLAGVVAGEMGRRLESEAAALRAQAIVSRTYAIRNRGRWRAQGFDLYATVADQVYGGLGVENALARAAVEATTGLILTYEGAPIDAFFYSTCGGRTAEGTEVFANARRPYLRAVWDQDAGGEAYCRISPRYRWRHEWSGEELRGMLRRTLPPVTGTAAEAITEIRSLRVAKVTASGRVAALAIGLRRGEVAVNGQGAVRQVLRPAPDQPLRSNRFTLTATARDGRLAHLVAEGGGAGHGVGFCQWGAVGRARAGQETDAILAAYYPGTQLHRLY
ncbi:MAG TPA: SpoIID/LytB domain-containing protein, partial [Gemmatimonadales bacterium]|nr:SpoIID/LytB domain-containing protein [Gemmatimonadales bacterium]